MLCRRQIRLWKFWKIKAIANKYPYQVSGGQQQRCACARALVNNSRLILADEPTGALDARNSEKLMEMFTEINEKFKTTIVMVTHDPFSVSYCNHIFFLKNGKISYELYKGARRQGAVFSSHFRCTKHLTENEQKIRSFSYLLLQSLLNRKQISNSF